MVDAPPVPPMLFPLDEEKMGVRGAAPRLGGSPGKGLVLRVLSWFSGYDKEDLKKRLVLRADYKLAKRDFTNCPLEQLRGCQSTFSLK